MSGESGLARQILELFPANKIEAIKLIREYSGLGLAETKSAVDRLWADLESARKSGRLSDDLVAISLQSSRVLRDPNAGVLPSRSRRFDLAPFFPDRKIEAIKFVREQTGFGLKEAKDLVDLQWPARGARMTEHGEHEIRSQGMPLVFWTALILVLAAAAWYFLGR